MRLAIRGWKNGALAFEEFYETEKDGFEDGLEAVATRHALSLADAPHMIEMEWLDEPNPDARFFRFGTDHKGMGKPIKIDLEWKREETP